MNFLYELFIWTFSYEVLINLHLRENFLCLVRCSLCIFVFEKFRCARAMVGKFATHNTLMLFLRINIDFSDSWCCFTNAFMAISHLKKYLDFVFTSTKTVLQDLLLNRSYKFIIFMTLRSVQTSRRSLSILIPHRTETLLVHIPKSPLWNTRFQGYRTPGTHQFALFYTATIFISSFSVLRYVGLGGTMPGTLYRIADPPKNGVDTIFFTAWIPSLWIATKTISTISRIIRIFSWQNLFIELQDDIY